MTDFATGDFAAGDFAHGDSGFADHDLGYRAGDWRSDDRWQDERSGGPDGLSRAGTDSGSAEFFGQIAIYTLLEDRVEEFDQLTGRVVDQVRSREPDTLVFIVHAVPSAPMQRILYEVYRDRAAYQRHLEQPYVKQFEADRRPLVLATNIIELGLQQAKVSPFPSVADLFGEPGYDTSGFERPDFLRDYGRTSGQAGHWQAGAPVSASGARITLLSRPGCHLCDDARSVIARVAGDLGVGWDERDITQSADDLAQYSEMIPVTFIDGVQHDFWRVSEERLRALRCSDNQPDQARSRWSSRHRVAGQAGSRSMA